MTVSNLIISVVLASFDYKCPTVKLQTVPPVNLTEYVRASWYIQRQQLTAYQQLNDLYCVTATYNKDKYSKVPFFQGDVISVYNYGNRGEVNGPCENFNKTVLCARVPNKNNPEKLVVAPCFLPNILGGPYYILAVGPYSNNYTWAIVIGGQPTVKMGNYTCTTSDNRINNSGLWLFTRERNASEKIIQNMYNILEEKNISTNKLYEVRQEGCNYTDAFLKY